MIPMESMEALCVCGHQQGDHNSLGECCEHHNGGWPPWWDKEDCDEFEYDWEANNPREEGQP